MVHIYTCHIGSKVKDFQLIHRTMYKIRRIPHNTGLLYVVNLFYVYRSPVAYCRQCPTYTGPLSPLCRGTSVPYACPAPGSHVMCQCCLNFMPIRSLPSDAPPQKCSLCDKYYCNQYWQSGCRGIDCHCLRPLKGTYYICVYTYVYLRIFE